ncbi:MAG: hypothetical protein ABJC04_08730 [Verrucomicrobiota bacterium]
MVSASIYGFYFIFEKLFSECLRRLPSAVAVIIFFSMQAHRTETVVSDDGGIILRDLPFRSGQSVEVIVLPFLGSSSSSSAYPLRGTPVSLQSPTKPVDDGDWEAEGDHP